MDILVVSDSHGRTSRILEAFERQIKKPDAIVFLGDGLRDVAYCDFGDVPLFAVCGNCDLYSSFGGVRGEDEILITLGGKRIMMTHGHEYGVKNGLGRLVMAALRKGADVVLFGHTHSPVEICLPAGETDFGINLEKPMYLMNPGSVGGYDASWGLLTIDNRGSVLLSHGSI